MYYLKIEVMKRLGNLNKMDYESGKDHNKGS